MYTWFQCREPVVCVRGPVPNAATNPVTRVKWHHWGSTSGVHPTHKQHGNAMWVIICTHSTTQHVNRMHRGRIEGSQRGRKRTPPTARTQTRSWCARCGAGSRCQTTKHTPISSSGISCIAHVHRSPPEHYPAHLQSNQREPDAVRQANRRHTHACARMSDACNAAVLM